MKNYIISFILVVILSPLSFCAKRLPCEWEDKNKNPIAWVIMQKPENKPWRTLQKMEDDAVASGKFPSGIDWQLHVYPIYIKYLKMKFHNEIITCFDLKEYNLCNHMLAGILWEMHNNPKSENIKTDDYKYGW